MIKRTISFIEGIAPDVKPLPRPSERSLHLHKHASRVGGWLLFAPR
jgi:hypothetical protein